METPFLDANLKFLTERVSEDPENIYYSQILAELQFLKQLAENYGDKAPVMGSCFWSADRDEFSGIYHTSCGEAFMFADSDGNPKEHSFTHCIYCGNEIKEQKTITT